jgi:hypothetical protein
VIIMRSERMNMCLVQHMPLPITFNRASKREKTGSKCNELQQEPKKK